MSDDGARGPQTIQAYITTAAGSILTASCMNWLPSEHIQYGVVISSLMTPFIAMYFAKIFLQVNEPALLVQYKSRLNRDMKNQKKLLKDPHLSESDKKSIRKKYGDTASKLATAHQDFSSGSLIIEKMEDRI